jgi:hypothetical protein
MSLAISVEPEPVICYWLDIISNSLREKLDQQTDLKVMFMLLNIENFCGSVYRLTVAVSHHPQIFPQD